jgi:hypothetical protein
MAERPLNELTDQVLRDGGYHIVRFGDLNQHEPPSSGKPLQYLACADQETKLKASTSDKPSLVKAYRGRQHFESIDAVIVLRQNHRLDANPDGQAMYALYEPFLRREDVTLQDAERVCEAINSKALPSTVPPNSNVLVLRNKVRTLMYTSLIQQQAHHDSKRLITWQAKYSSRDGMPIPSCFKNLLDSVPGPEKGDIESPQFFYEDIEYVLMESKYPMLGMCKNKVALGKQIILDPREPEDERIESVWKLQYMPLAIIVHPTNTVKNEDICHDNSIPQGCIILQPESQKNLLITLPEPLTINGTEYSSLSYNIHGFRLNYHILFTDYSAQGMSFRPPTNWICHLNPPPTGRFQGKSIFVTLSRYVSYSSFQTLCSLWTPGDTTMKQDVINKFFKAMKKDPNLIAELLRLDQVAELTRQRYHSLSVLASEIVRKHKSRRKG